jgi:hypothetical protein
MKFYCIALILILVAMASGQPEEGNATNNTVIDNSSVATEQLQEGNAKNNTVLNDTQDKLNQSPQESDNIYLNFQVAEIAKDTRARFGVGKKEAAKHEMYKLSITNKGDIRIENVTVFAVMIEDMKFESSRYYEDGRGRLGVEWSPCYFMNGTKTKLKWNIASLEPEEIKSILLEAYLRPNINNANITVNVTGILKNAEVTKSKPYANVTKCDYVDKNTGNICDNALDTENCESRCPDWSYPL